MATRKVLLRLGLTFALIFVLEAPMALAKCRDRPEPGVDWTRCEKERLILREADLSGAILERTDLSDADMTEAKLTGAKMVQANLARTRLHRADLSGANMSKVRGDRTEFQGANLSRVNLSKAELPRANLAGADLTASVPFKYQVQSVAASTITLATGFGRAGEVVQWRPPHRHFAGLVGDNVDDVFRAVVTNMDNSQAADLYAAFYYQDN